MDKKKVLVFLWQIGSKLHGQDHTLIFRAVDRHCIEDCVGTTMGVHSSLPDLLSTLGFRVSVLNHR